MEGGAWGEGYVEGCVYPWRAVSVRFRTNDDIVTLSRVTHRMCLVLEWLINTLFTTSRKMSYGLTSKKEIGRGHGPSVIIHTTSRSGHLGLGTAV